MIHIEKENNVENTHKINDEQFGGFCRINLNVFKSK